MQYCYIIILILSLFFIFYALSQNKESFGTPIGSLAPYREHITECINQCNKSDSTKRLLKSPNMYCDRFCQSVFTDISRLGIPPSKIPLKTDLSICEKNCENIKNENIKRNCISTCHGQREALEYCKKIQCPYSTLPEYECMEQCFLLTNLNNNSVSWNWGLKN
jgi:hypothetical protein